MQKTIRDLQDYYEIITRIWAYFRKFYTEYNADAALQELLEFEKWVKTKGPRLYEFGMQIIKIAWKEVGELHEMRKENAENQD